MSEGCAFPLSRNFPVKVYLSSDFYLGNLDGLPDEPDLGELLEGRKLLLRGWLRSYRFCWLEELLFL